MVVRIVGPREYAPGAIPEGVINTTSRSRDWSRGLSPFFLGPVPLYPGAPVPEAKNVENAWQYAKVYPRHVDPFGMPTPSYFEWAAAGWASSKAERYPMGKGKKPVYTWWAGEKLTYTEARKKVYVPLYAHAVAQCEAFGILRALYRERGEITLWDFDGYDHLALGMTFKDVLNSEVRKMGHAFVLAYLLERLEGGAP